MVLYEELSVSMRKGSEYEIAAYYAPKGGGRRRRDVDAERDVRREQTTTPCRCG